MVKPDKIFCACPENKMTQKTLTKDPITRKRTEASKCNCFVGSETKKGKLQRFVNIKVKVDGVEVL